MIYDKDDIVSTIDGEYTYSIVGVNHDEKLYDDYGDNYEGSHNLSFYESELRFATPKECNTYEFCNKNKKITLDLSKSALQ